MCKEFLCDCLQCLQLDFDKCMKLSAEENPVAPVDLIHHEDEGNFDVDEEDESHKVFEFVAVPPFAALISEDFNGPVYILIVEEKGRAEKEEDDFEQCIPAGDLYIRGKYLKKETSRSTRVHKCSMLSADAICTQDEIFDVFVDVSEDLTIEKETFRELLSRAGSF